MIYNKPTRPQGQHDDQRHTSDAPETENNQPPGGDKIIKNI